MREWPVLSEGYARVQYLSGFCSFIFFWFTWNVSIGMCRVQNLEYSIFRVFVAFFFFFFSWFTWDDPVNEEIPNT